MDVSFLRAFVEGMDWQQYAPYALALFAALLLVLYLWRRRRAKKVLREREELYRAVVEQVAEGVFLFDVESKQVLEANPALEYLLGFAASELREKTLYDLIAHDRESVDANVKSVLEEKRFFVGERRYRRKDGSLADLEVSARAISCGGRAAICAVARDVTERKRAEEELREAEIRYRTVVEQVPAIFYVKDVETGRTLYDGPQIEEILGYPADTYAKDPGYWCQILHPDDHERVLKAEKEAFGSGLFRLEYRCFARNGHLVWLRDESRLVRDEEGSPRFWRGVIFDITGRKRSEEALRESEERYRSLVQLSPDVVAVQSEGRLLYINDAGAEVLGASSPREVLGKPVLDLVHPDFREVAKRRMRRLREGEPLDLLEEKWVRLDGREIEVEVAAAPIAHNGKPAAQIVLRDVTARKQTQRQVMRQKAELARSNAELEQFAYLVARDLRAPLRSLHGFAQTLLEDHARPLSNEGRRYLERIRGSARKMGGMIDELLDLSRLTRAEMRREPVDLSALARSIAAELRKVQPDRRAEFIVAGGLTAEGDRRLLRVALSNLLENAWKFTRNTPRARIVFGQIQRDQELVFFVRDNGIGFDMAYAGKLFGPFQRLHPEDEFEGDGVGLTAVARVIERHGGRVWAEGAQGQGATFYFTL